MQKSILVVDDHQIVYSGIQLIFSVNTMEYEMESCKNGDECLELLRKRSFDLVILDVNLPDTDTFQLIGLILFLNPDQKILMYSMSAEEIYARRFLKLGTKGFISKQASNDEFIVAVKTVLGGDIYISPTMIRRFADEVITGGVESVFDQLSPREFEIMSFFLSGLGSKEVANITNLHSSTIGTYKYKIFEKLGVKNFIELHELAKVNGLKFDRF